MELETTLTLIQQEIDKLRQLTQVDVQNNWFICDDDLSIEQINSIFSHASHYPIAPLNSKGYITWSAGSQVKWLGQKFIIPHTLKGYPLKGLSLRLQLTWWAELAQIFVNGKLLQEGDLFDSSVRILLASDIGNKQQRQEQKAIAPSTQQYREFTVALRLVSPKHDIGALMQSKCIYEFAHHNHKTTTINTKEEKKSHNRLLTSELTELNIDPGFVADELTVLSKYWATFAPDKLSLLAATITTLDWDNVTDAHKFNQSLSDLRAKLKPHAKSIKQSCLNLLGHAHLDLAWLWQVADTYTVAENTFKSVLSLQQDFPELIFCHSTPALYAWLEINRPELFNSIQQAVKLNKWEALGAMWVEPEVNLLGGESIVRQLLYGQRYFQEKFGAISPIVWLPDSFGFPWSLPQFLQQAGVQYFVTGKLHWNDTNKFPYGCFWWQSPDGSKVLGLMSPPNVTGVMDTNPITMANYACEWQQQTGFNDAFWLPGVGDHGGGPTRDMLEIQRKWQESPFFPPIEFTTAHDYLAKVNKPDLPVWNDELYLELHRGCYTTHADQKYFNRYCEGLLYQGELFSTLLRIMGKDIFISASHFNNSILETQIKHSGEEKQQATGNKQLVITQSSSIDPGIPYISSDKYKETDKVKVDNSLFEKLWKGVLFNQFHDILPGTSIPEVFVDANQIWHDVIRIGEDILEQSLQAIAAHIALPEPPHIDARPIVVFNSLNWQRSQVVSLDISNISSLSSHNWQVSDLEGNKLISQVSADNTLLFLAENIPSIGYRCFWIFPETNITEGQTNKRKQHESVTVNEYKFILENEYLKVIVTPDTGELSSIYDKKNQREVLSNAGNQLQTFQDQGQYWDAWNIDPNYEQFPLTSRNDKKVKSIEYLENGLLQGRIRVTKTISNSEVIQDYILQKNCPILKIDTKVNWQEDHVLLKAAFPLTIESEYVTYEIPCGVIDRPTAPKNKIEEAKWEVSALRWADLSNNNYGVSLLNNCKYGYDSKPNQLRLTLLRSPKWPNPYADQGEHYFSYGIYPHQGNWQQANTVNKGYEFNLPLLTIIPEINFQAKNNLKQDLPPQNSFLYLGADNLILMAFKIAEDSNNKNKIILRCYECNNKKAKISISSYHKLLINKRNNLLEQDVSIYKNRQKIEVKPYQIVNYSINF